MKDKEIKTTEQDAPEGIAAFLYKPLREELEPAHKYRVIANVELSEAQWEHFKNNLMADQQFITEHARDLYMDENGIWRVLEVTSAEADHVILVCSEGYDYARYAAYKKKERGIENGQENKL